MIPVKYKEDNSQPFGFNQRNLQIKYWQNMCQYNKYSLTNLTLEHFIIKHRVEIIPNNFCFHFHMFARHYEHLYKRVRLSKSVHVSQVLVILLQLHSAFGILLHSLSDKYQTFLSFKDFSIFPPDNEFFQVSLPFSLQCPGKPLTHWSMFTDSNVYSSYQQFVSSSYYIFWLRTSRNILFYLI